MAIRINILNAGNMTLGGAGGGSSEHADTRFTLSNGTVESYDITNTDDYHFDMGWMIQNGYLDGNTMQWLKEITEADIGNTVTKIEGLLFYGSSTLRNVIIPDSVIEIGDQAFQGCIGLTSMTIPNSVKIVGTQAFDMCNNLTTITVLGKTTTEAQAWLANAGVPEGCEIVGELG